MANYPVDPAALAPFLPAGTEPDFHEGRTFISMVGFRFLQTRLLGGRVAVPCHRDFDEVNLRFYVRRRDPASGEWRRGVVFVKEIVPRLAIAAVARLRYRERYIAAPMHSQIDAESTEFSWRIRGVWNRLEARLTVAAEPSPWQESAPGSEEEFISEHYWGYSDRAARGRRTLEYAVEHPRWRVRAVRDFHAELPSAEILYGPEFCPGAPVAAAEFRLHRRRLRGESVWRRADHRRLTGRPAGRGRAGSADGGALPAYHLLKLCCVLRPAREKAARAPD